MEPAYTKTAEELERDYLGTPAKSSYKPLKTQPTEDRKSIQPSVIDDFADKWFID